MDDIIRNLKREQVRARNSVVRVIQALNGFVEVANEAVKNPFSSPDLRIMIQEFGTHTNKFGAKISTLASAIDEDLKILDSS
jgi:hypothetical protein